MSRFLNNTHLYQSDIGYMVNKCHKLCASINSIHGGKSKSSMLMAKVSQATAILGHVAQSVRDSRYLLIEKPVQSRF